MNNTKYLTRSERMELIKNLAMHIRKTGLVGKDGEWGYYRIHVQSVTFECVYSDEELVSMIGICIQIMEELKKVRDNGLTLHDLNLRRTELEQYSGMEVYGDEDQYMHMVWLALSEMICTDSICELIRKLCIVSRVQGTWAVFAAVPALRRTIAVIYCEALAERMDETGVYITCLCLLVYSAMHIHGDDLGPLADYPSTPYCA